MGIPQRYHRIDKTRGPGTRIEPVDGIRFRVRVFRMAGGQRGCQMPAGGESQRADARRVYPEFRGARADQSHGALGILKRYVGARRPAFARQAVRQHENGVTLCSEPRCQVGAFIDHGDKPVGTTGHHQQRAAIRGRAGRNTRSSGMETLRA